MIHGKELKGIGVAVVAVKKCSVLKMPCQCFEVTLPEKISESFSHYCITIIRKFQQKKKSIIGTQL